MPQRQVSTCGSSAFLARCSTSVPSLRETFASSNWLLSRSMSAERKRRVTLMITDFVIPLDDVPEDIQRAVSKWPQWIDYWAVDWDNHGDTFHNEWQTYRTRKNPDLELSTSHEYECRGSTPSSSRSSTSSATTPPRRSP